MRPAMRAVIVNCTLKPSPEPSNTEALAQVVAEALEKDGVTVDWVRAVDHDIKPGVESDMGDGDAWPAIRRQIVAAEILVVATPTWVGRPSSVAQRVIERMDAMISETDDQGRPVAYNRVAGVVNTGNEDGAHHVISEISGALADIGFTIPGQAWTYWHLGPGAGPNYLDDQRGHDWAAKTGRAMAQNLATVARALAMTPLQAPPD
jgi:multimeric flavodoxin WrbA